MTSPAAPHPTMRLVEQARAIDPRKALEGIKADRSKNGMRGKRKSSRRTL